MLRNLFHISVIAQVLIPLIMAHVPANGEVPMAILYADGQRVPLTFRMEDSGLAYVTSQRLSSRFVLVNALLMLRRIYLMLSRVNLHTPLVAFRIEMRTITCSGLFIQVVTESMASLNLRWLLLLRSSLLALLLPAPFKLLCHVM
jgi:hypothetical protein